MQAEDAEGTRSGNLQKYIELLCVPIDCGNSRNNAVKNWGEKAKYACYSLHGIRNYGTVAHTPFVCKPKIRSNQLKLEAVNVYATPCTTFAILTPLHTHPLHVNQKVDQTKTKIGMTEYAYYFLHDIRNSGTVAHTSVVCKPKFEQTNCGCF